MSAISQMREYLGEERGEARCCRALLSMPLSVDSVDVLGDCRHYLLLITEFCAHLPLFMMPAFYTMVRPPPPLHLLSFSMRQYR
jgi:hypothetical protein